MDDENTRRRSCIQIKMEDENVDAGAAKQVLRKSTSLICETAVSARRSRRPRGPEFWRSLEELAGSEEFQEMMHREFPKGASEWLDAVSRRGFLKLMGASLALAGHDRLHQAAAGADRSVCQAAGRTVPGQPMFYATAFTLGGYATRCWWRATCIGLPRLKAMTEHPASLGGTDIFAQASILEMYDPDRSQTMTYLGDVRTWGDFVRRDPRSAECAEGSCRARAFAF